MKFAIVVLALVAAASAQLSNPFKPYNRFSSNRYNQYSTPAPYRAFSTIAPFAPSTFAPPIAVPISVARVVNDARNAETVRYSNDLNPDGSYSYIYETNNGIAAQEQGTPRAFGGNPPVAPIVAQGSYSYTSPEGETIAISYIADENGFQPTGNAIPTPHPIPEAILRSLEFNARNAPQK